jgi:iron complex outermembrane receptor protein
MSKSIIVRHAVRCVLISSAVVCSAPSFAADPATPTETIIVTGSNIRRADTETPAPVQVVTREEIDRTGKSTIGEYLQTLTSDGQGSVPKSFGNGFASGGTAISLRGLGASSTLVLLNGRRIAPYGLADDAQKVFTDISVIPMEAVARVEVLKDGASAIYGSDAIAGVVNIILKDEFSGLKLKGSYGESGDSDGQSPKGSATWGFGDRANDGYNAYFNLEAAKTDSIKVSDRKDRKWIGSGDARPYGYGGTSQFLAGYIIPGAASSGPAGAVRIPTGPNAGNYQALAGCDSFPHLTPNDPGGGCLWQAGQFRDLAPQEKYINGFGHLSFNISESLEGYAEAGYSHKNYQFNNTPSGVSGSWGYPGGPVNASSGPGATVLGATHPDNPFPGTAVRLRYSAWDVGPRTGDVTNNFWRAVAGVKGTLAGWDVDTAFEHSQSDLTFKRTGFLQYSHVLAALSGTGPITWRVGQNAGLNSQAVYDYISPTLESDGKSKLDSFDVKASRELFQLPGGSFGLALGAEYRHLETSLSPATHTDAGDIIGLGFSSYAGTQNLAGTYVEVLAPVVTGLELNGALRYDHYMNGEDSTTPKVGFKWSPVRWGSVRGTYSQGFRAPNPAENGKGGLAAFTSARDSVRCPITGLAVDCSASVALIVTPNPLLKPEKSKTYTLGLVLSPARDTTVTIDGWKIERSNEINTEATQAAIDRGAVLRSDNLLNGVPGTGSILAVNEAYINSSKTTVKGVDLDVRQGFDLGGYGRLNLDMQWTYIDSFLREEPDGSQLEFAGTHGNCDVTNCIGTPHTRINFGATWDMDTFSISTVVNFRGALDNVAFKGDTCANSFADGTDAPHGCQLASFYSVDLSGRYTPMKNLNLTMTVSNLFDRIAPLDPLTYGAINYNPLDASGAIGRFFVLGASYSFE